MNKPQNSRDNNNQNSKRKPRLSFKEQKEKGLLDALDAQYESEDRAAAASGQPAPQTPQPKEELPQSQPKTATSTSPPASSNRTIVYIDGENTFFQIFDALRKTRLIKYRDDLVKFDLKMMLDHMLGDLGGREDRYYGAKLHEIDSSEELLQRTQKMIDHKRRWIGFLSNQGVQFISAGKLVIRPDINAVTKKEELVFTEKGVDVSLAVDMTEAAAAKNIDTVVLWSSDQDLKPAMLAAQKHGVKVIYLTHEQRINDVMTGSASETRLIPSDLIKQAYEKVN